MSCFIKKEEIQAFQQSKENGIQKHLYELLKSRVSYNTRENRLVQSSDTQEWYHLVWERMSDAAFLYHMEKDERLGKWVHDRTMEIVKLSAEDWVGPWYRNNLRKRKVGALETGHITLAVCEAYENARDVFTPEEQQEIREALRTKGMLLCRRFADEILEGKSGYNWFMVLLNGYGTAAIVLEEKEEIRHALELIEVLAKLYNADSYGESVQYSNYASLHLAFLMEIMIRSGNAEVSGLPISCYGNLMEWYAASFQRMKYAEEFQCEVPRTFAFGDSSNLFRPTGNLLAHIAVRLKESDPKKAGLASWLFETVYGQERPLTDELATFGFFNQFAYHSILMYPDMCKPLSPREAGLPLDMRFEVGHILIRDRWEDPRMALAIAGGYEPLHTHVHRHLDQNSFQLTVGRERMLVDPGHCCYRLESQKKSLDEISHNVVSVRYHDRLLRQRPVEQEWGRGEASVFNKLLVNEHFGNLQIIISDATGLYEKPVARVVRIWVVRVPDIVAVADYVLAEAPVELITRLVANNRDNRLQMERRDAHLLTLKRRDSILEVYQAQSMADGEEEEPDFSYEWSFLHNYYHPLPNQAGQGKEGSASVYVWTSSRKAKEHRRIQVYVGRCSDTCSDSLSGMCSGSCSGSTGGYDVVSKEDGISVMCNGEEAFRVRVSAGKLELWEQGKHGRWNW